MKFDFLSKRKIVLSISDLCTGLSVHCCVRNRNMPQHAKKQQSCTTQKSSIYGQSTLIQKYKSNSPRWRTQQFIQSFSLTRCLLTQSCTTNRKGKYIKEKMLKIVAASVALAGVAMSDSVPVVAPTYAPAPAYEARQGPKTFL